ncbi:restriction endonuclease subunit S [Hymenobacter tenuis]
MESAVAEIEIQKYESSKDSGVEWLGEIPDHWLLLPGSRVVNERCEKNKGMVEKTVLSLSYGKVVIKPEEKLVGLVPESFETYQLVYPGDIIIRPTDLQNDKTSLRTGLAKDKGIITSAYINLQVHKEYSGRYYHYFLYALDITKMIYSLGSGLRQNLSFEDFKRFKFLVPPSVEQTAIANFLDRKTAQIDQAIDQKERLIERLQERRQILIQRAVTRGLNTDVPMKDSGVEWIGEVPAHWEIVRSKALFQERKEKARKDDKQLTASQKYGMISQEEFMQREGRRVTVVLLDRDILKHIEANDFVISMRSFQGGLEHSNLSGCVSSAYIPLIPIKHIVPEYFKYLFKCEGYIKALSSTSNLVRDGQAMRFENFAAVPLLVVPEEEQESIAEFLDKQHVQQQRTTVRLGRQIDKLREYKSTLIYAAVTGKIKVC